MNITKYVYVDDYKRRGALIGLLWQRMQQQHRGLAALIKTLDQQQILFVSEKRG